MTIPTDPHLLYQDWLLTETQFVPEQLKCELSADS